MHSDALQRKVREAAAKTKDVPLNLSKEHIVVTYSFCGKQGQRVLRSEGMDAFGSALYYDYRTNAIKSLEAHARSWGVKGIKETHKVDLANLQAIRIGADQQQDEQHTTAPQTPPERTQPQDSTQHQQPSVPDSSHGGNTPPTRSPPSQPPQQPQNSAHRPPRQQTQPGRQAPKKGDADAPVAAPDVFKVPAAPPQGKPAKGSRHSAFSSLLSEPQPFFSGYLQAYYKDGPMRCASGAWGLIMPYLLAEEGKAAVIFPVSSWRLKNYVKKPGISSLVTDLAPAMATNADLYNVLACRGIKLKKGTVITLDSGHPYDGKKRGDPSHTMVYGGVGIWFDNRSNVEIYANIFDGASEATSDGLKRRFAKLAKGSISDQDISRLAQEGSWITKGSYFIARENGSYAIYDSERAYVSFKRMGTAALPQTEDDLRAAVGDPRAIVTQDDIKKINSLGEGECHYVQREIGNLFLFSSRDKGARQSSIALFGRDVFADFQPNQLVDEVTGNDGLVYSIRREKDPSGKYGEVNVYSPMSETVHYIIKKEGSGISVSAKRSDFLGNFGWTANSGLYGVNFSKMPPSRERIISSRDFGLEKVTAEGFAALLSKSYGVMFEYALNEIMKQNKVPSARAYVNSLDVQIAVMVPDAVLGRLLASPIEMVETPAEKKFWKEYESFKNQSTGAQWVLLKQLTDRRNEYFRRCAEIDNTAQKMGVPAINVDALKVVMFNEMYSSHEQFDWYSRISQAEAKGFSSNREAKKNFKRDYMSWLPEWEFKWAPKWTGLPKVGELLAPLKSWGYFQQNIDYVQRYLDGYPKDMLYYGGKRDLSDKKASQDRRKDLIERLKGTSGGDEVIIKLRIWERIAKDDKRDALMDMLGGSLPFSLHMANMLFLQNKANFEDQARLYAGRNYTSTDLEMTTVFSYNRGMGRGNLTIFQQNLLVVSQNIMKTAKGEQAQQFMSAMKGFYISGAVKNRSGEEKTLQLFKAVCEAKGISSVSFGKNTYETDEITSAILNQELARSSMRYKNACSFFSMPQFKPADFSTASEPGNASPFPMLHYSYLSSKQNAQYITPYVLSYLFFAEPAEKTGESGPVLEQQISARGKNGRLEVNYTVPTYPGLVSLKVYSQDGKVAHSFLDMARQRPGHYVLETPLLKHGFYKAELQVGDKKIPKIVYVPAPKEE